MGNTGKAVIIEGIRGVENAESRKQGFTEALTTDSTITVVASETANWHTEEAFSVMAERLQRHETIDAVLCVNNNMALTVTGKRPTLASDFRSRRFNRLAVDSLDDCKPDY